MPTVKVQQKTEGEAQTVYKKLRKYCDQKLILKELGNLKPEVDWDDENREGTFEEKGVKGTISVKFRTFNTG